ncbi:helix-turn-helix domain-containing protein [Paracoccus denitrificans]|uniref:helix-turn-helix domain-containing protein n=1 Tax=Paracoccus denitrificans TaxID=266 RepID=UPI001319C6A8|nr:AraC family transcriptional regulator [Paracoccus denitrificans]
MNEKNKLLIDLIPDEWGSKLERDGFAVVNTHAPPADIQFTSPMHVALVMLSAQPDRQVALNSDRRQTGLAPVGSLELFPRGSDLFALWPTEKQSVLIAFTDDHLKQLAGEEFDNDTFSLRPLSIGSIDRDALEFAKRIKREIENSELGHVDSLNALATLLGVHMLRNYSTIQTRTELRSQGGLTPNTWRRVHDFIRGNLSEKLTLVEMAREARLSPSYFSRAFLKTTGQSPHQFVIALRLAQAKHMITETNEPLEAIARATGFSKHSHLTALMRRKWNVTPSDLRRDRDDIAASGESEGDA